MSSDNLIYVRRREPSLTPGAAVAASQSPDPESSAALLAGLRWAVDVRDRLKRRDRFHQLDAWGDFKDAERELLSQVGYEVPHHLKEPANWAERFIGRPVGFVVGGTLGNVVEHLNKSFQESAEQVIQHPYRFLSAVFQEHVDPTEGGVPDLGRLWRETKEGEKFIRADKIRSELPPEYRDVAIDLAKGMPPGEVAIKYGPDVVYAAEQDPSFQRFAAELELRKVSFGRDIYNGLGLRRIAKPGEKVTLLPGSRIGPIKTTPQIEVDFAATFSGELDGLWRFYADPLNKPLQGVAALRRARYLVESADDVLRHSAKPEVQKAYARVVQAFQEGGAARFAETFPAQANYADEFARMNGGKGPENIGEVQDFFAGKASVVAVAQGRSSRYLESIRWGPTSQVRLAAKDAGEELVEKMRTSRVPGIRQTGRFVHRAVSLNPRGVTLDLESEQAFETVRQTLRYTLPQGGLQKRRINEIMNLFAKADLGGKKLIYASGLDELGNALGAKTNPDLRAVFDRIIGGVTGEFERVFAWDRAGGPLSHMARDGADAVSLGVLEHHGSAFVQVPSYRDIVDVSSFFHRMNQGVIPGMKGMAGKVPEGFIHAAMERMWKPLVVLRLGFPVRAGGEEAARMMLEDGLVPYSRAWLAARGVRLAEKYGVSDIKDPLIVNQILTGQRIAAQGASDTARLAANGMDPLVWAPMRDYFVYRTVAAISDKALILAGGDYREAAELLLRHHGVGMLPEELHAGIGSKAIDSAPTIRSLVRDLRKPGGSRRVVLKPGHGWDNYGQRNQAQSVMWESELARARTNPSFKVWAEHHADPDAARSALLDYLKSDEAAGIRRTMARAKQHSKGEEYLDGLDETARQEVIFQDWAEKMDEAYRGLLYSPFDEAGNSVALDDIIESLKNDKVPPAEFLDTYTDALRPKIVSGHEQVLVHEKGMLQGIINYGFNSYVDPLINAISRQPIMVHETAKALKALRKQRVALEAELGTKAAGTLIDREAIHTAFRKTLPLVDDPTLRSQLQQAHRAILPFWYAQEQFLKRWGKALFRDPSIYRRAQLTMMGLEHSGFIQRDEQGQAFFMYPGVMFTQGVIGQAGRFIWGDGAQTVVPVGFRGDVAGLNPGTQRPFLPSFGPVMSIPLSLAAQRFDPLMPAAGRVLGDWAAEKSIMEQVFPTVMQRLGKAFLADENADEQWLSAQAQAMQYLEATGKGLPDNPSTGEISAYQDRVRSWGRTLMVNRALFGFAAPSGIQTNFVKSLAPEFKDLLKTMPFNEAIAEFIRRHPDGTPYTVFTTKLAPGGKRPLPATTAAGEFFERNSGFFKKHGPAATWFLPPAPEQFSIDVWGDEVAMELRVRKTPEEMLKAIKVAKAETIWQPSYRAYQQALAGASPAQRQQIGVRWNEWKQAFFNLNPFFAEYMERGESSEGERRRGLERLRKAMADPNRPKVEHETALREVLDVYSEYRRAYDAMYGRRDKQSRRSRALLTESFYHFGSTHKSPAAQQLFLTLIAPDLQGV